MATFNLFNMKHWWFSGRILACHAGGPGSIPGQCTFFYRYKMATRQLSSPFDVRIACRHGSLQSFTGGLASGFLQAGVTALPRSLADDFAKFCALNYGSLPLLYKSAPGETGAPLLAEDSDVRCA